MHSALPSVSIRVCLVSGLHVGKWKTYIRNVDSNPTTDTFQNFESRQSLFAAIYS